MRLCHCAYSLTGEEVNPVSRLRHSHQLHTIFSALLLHPPSGHLSLSHTHTDTRVLDGYLTASNSLLGLKRGETVHQLCLEGFLPCLDLCKDTAESGRLHPSSVSTPIITFLSTSVIHLPGFCLAPSHGP